MTRMKFFTQEVFDAGEHEDFRRLDEEHLQHLEGLQDQIPYYVRTLEKVKTISDGLVVRVGHVRIQKRMKLILRIGDSLYEYVDIIISYFDAEISAEDDLVLATIARTTTRTDFRFDLAAHELDFVDGKIEHRLMFHDNSLGDHDKKVFAIRCRDLKWRFVGRATRLLPDFADRYPNGPGR